MADCSGYGIGVKFQLCVDGPVGNGKKANLIIYIDNAGRYSFDENTPIEVSNWDGSALKLDVTALVRYGFDDANCSEMVATLSVIPDGGSDGGKLLLEFALNNCDEATNSYDPQVFENCGGPGPHLISEMSTFKLDGIACPS